MLGLLNSLGDELVRLKDWQFLQQVMSFTGDGVKDTFDLPVNFGRQVNQTQWDSSNFRPLQGPVSPQVWAWSQFGLVGTGIFYRYRIVNNQYNVWPVPADGNQFDLYYISKDWVRDGAVEPPATPVYYDRVKKGVDVPQFDRRLMIAGLKLKFWAQKGFDTTQLAKEYNDILAMEMAQTQGAAIINLSGGSGRFLLSEANVPETGFGV